LTKCQQHQKNFILFSVMNLKIVFKLKCNTSFYCFFFFEFYLFIFL
jgi:hypothetical protein